MNNMKSFLLLPYKFNSIIGNGENKFIGVGPRERCLLQEVFGSNI